jgi:hypothetical protein
MLVRNAAVCSRSEWSVHGFVVDGTDDAAPTAAVVPITVVVVPPIVLELDEVDEEEATAVLGATELPGRGCTSNVVGASPAAIVVTSFVDDALVEAARVELTRLVAPETVGGTVTNTVTVTTTLAGGAPGTVEAGT